MIKSVLVLGAGSAGLMAALAVQKKLPSVTVRVVRDPALGVIGVGESTTPSVPTFLFGCLGISPKVFYQLANPTWKIGIHFLWGRRPCFRYPFDKQFDVQRRGLPRSNGFYCWENFDFASPMAALMAQNKAFLRQPNGVPQIADGHAFHLYNPDFVKALEFIGTERGIEYVDGIVEQAEPLPTGGIKAVRLKDGRRFEADFFIDASGFKSELLGKVMEEPFESFGKSLFCDRAVVGSWERAPDEPILPYTTVETMDAGWCWKIEHEKYVNRGYVYCSADISEDQAHAEFMRNNPKAKTWDHAVKFKSGRYRRAWVDNVAAVGNASGFVEPLEATALMVLVANVETLVDVLSEVQLQPTPSIRRLYNEVSAAAWDEIKEFLAIHYRFNHRLDTPFWTRCVHEADISGNAELLAFYKENGPLGLCRHRIGNLGRQFGIHSAFGVDGYLAVLTGCEVPYENRHLPTEQEWALWNQGQAELTQAAAAGATVEESLTFVRHPAWQWNADAMREKAATEIHAQRQLPVN
jgi:tryptophan halogenase